MTAPRWLDERQVLAEMDACIARLTKQSEEAFHDPERGERLACALLDKADAIEQFKNNIRALPSPTPDGALTEEERDALEVARAEVAKERPLTVFLARELLAIIARLSAPRDAAGFEKARPNDECQQCGADACRGAKLRSICEDCLSAWQPIETAPKDGTHILIFGKAGWQNGAGLPATAHWFDGDWQLSVNQRAEFSEYVWRPVTHWMPLPHPPSKAAGLPEKGE